MRTLTVHRCQGYKPRYPWQKAHYRKHITYTNKSFYTAPTWCYTAAKRIT